MRTSQREFATASSPGGTAPVPVVAPPARILIADDHVLVRRGLQHLLEGEDDLQVVGEATTLDEVHTAVEQLHPDVVVLDLNMPRGSVLDAIPLLRRHWPSLRIVILTMQNEPAYAREALARGAEAYVVKDAADSELVEAIHAVLDGRVYLNPRLRVRIAGDGTHGYGDELSPREAEVLRMIALGYTNAEIASQLSLSVRTVETHRAHVQQKLCLSSRAELVRYALAHRLVDV